MPNHIFISINTTGLDYKACGIYSISYIVDGVNTEYIINPFPCDISTESEPFIPKDITDYPTINKVWSDMYQDLRKHKDSIIVVWNIHFTKKFIEHYMPGFCNMFPNWIELKTLSIYYLSSLDVKLEKYTIENVYNIIHDEAIDKQNTSQLKALLLHEIYNVLSHNLLVKW